jgi:hypothetical protein
MDDSALFHGDTVGPRESCLGDVVLKLAQPNIDSWTL